MRLLAADAVGGTEIILDLDATDDPVHGRQEGRFLHGYYGTTAICRCTSSRASTSVRLILSADSGFCRDALRTWCKTHAVDYVIGLAKNARALNKNLYCARGDTEIASKNNEFPHDLAGHVRRARLPLPGVAERVTHVAGLFCHQSSRLLKRTAPTWISYPEQGNSSGSGRCSLRCLALLNAFALLPILTPCAESASRTKPERLVKARRTRTSSFDGGHRRSFGPPIIRNARGMVHCSTDIGSRDGWRVTLSAWFTTAKYS